MHSLFMKLLQIHNTCVSVLQMKYLRSQSSSIILLSYQQEKCQTLNRTQTQEHQQQQQQQQQ